MSVMKAMAMGAIPITSRYAESVVPELTDVYDLGLVSPRVAATQVPVTLLNWRPPTRSTTRGATATCRPSSTPKRATAR